MTKKPASLILIFTASLVCYMGTFHYPFHFDDEVFFMGEFAGKYLKNINTIWEFNPARFVNFLTFGVNYWIGGVDAFGYHIVNFSIHVLNGVALFWLAGMLSAKIVGNGEDTDETPWRFYPLFVALVFVTHPVQTQAVTYLWQRATSLSSLFYLLSLALYAKSRLIVIARSDSGEAISQTNNQMVPDRHSRQRLLRDDISRFFQQHSSAALLILSLFSGLMAMFTKQIAVTLPVAVVLMELYFFSGSWSGVRKKAPILAVFLPLLLIVPLLSAFGMSRENSDIGARYANVLSHKEYLLTQFNVIVTYIRLMFYPVNQNLDYDYPVAGNIGGSLVSFVLLAGLLGFALAMYKRNRIVSFGLLFFFLALSVESSIFQLEDIIFEHRVYLPSAGFIMAVGAALFMAAERLDSRIGAGKIFPATVILAVFLITGLAIATRTRNEVWRDKETLWLDVLKKSPNKWRGHFHMGTYCTDKGDLDEAIAWYKKALKLNPALEEAHYKLGRVYDKKGELDSAITEYSLSCAVTQKNNHIVHSQIGSQQLLMSALVRIGDVYMKKGDIRLGRDYYLKALSVSPGFAVAKERLKKAEAVMGSGGSISPSAQRAGN
jgi:hypothetical protein